MLCSIHKGPIRGRIHRWNHRPMCRSCYAHFTASVRVNRTPAPRPQLRPKPPKPQGNKGLLKKLIKLLS